MLVNASKTGLIFAIPKEQSIINIPFIVIKTIKNGILHFCCLQQLKHFKQLQLQNEQTQNNIQIGKHKNAKIKNIIIHER